MRGEKDNLEKLMRQEGISAFGEEPHGPGASAAGRLVDLPDAAGDGATVAPLPEDRPDLQWQQDCWHAAGLEREMKKARKTDRSENSLDLHGMTVAEAWREINDFLIRARQQGQRVLEIVHGYGRTLGCPGVLRGKVRGWLHASDEVIWFCERRANRGATLLCLRGRRRPR